ncbi:hypothetical protein AWENTII_012907 [Aspergillus wentii]|nr:hypothetical protein MW887_005830 [Aspergillus wentii]
MNLFIFLFFICIQALPNTHWVDIWTSMPQLTEPDNLPPPPFNASTIFANTTIRQTIHLTQNTSTIRLRFSNAFGLADLPISNVTISLPQHQKPGTSLSDTETVKKLTFNGDNGIIIPTGALAVSDPIDFPVQAQSELMVSLYLRDGQDGGAITSHPGSRTTSWMARGNFVEKVNLTDAMSVEHWYYISAVEALLPSSTSAFAIIGDSITDGRGSDTDGNNRWPDLLLTRMQAFPETSSISILNQAAGGNRVLKDGLGPNALSRIDRDILAHSGVRYAMLFEGVNDIGVTAADEYNQTMIGDRLIVAYQQIVTRLHAADIPVFGGTITPFGTSSNASYVQPYSHPEREKTRQRVNEWIRTSGVFDAVVDFDEMLRDPDQLDVLAEEYDSGDHLHPNVRGYQALADGFPLEIFNSMN